MVKIVYKNNNPFIQINGEILPPAAFRSFRPTPANIAMFARCGVRFYQMLISGLNNALNTKYSLFGEVWKGPKEYDFTAFDRQMAMFREFASDGYFNVMIQLDTPAWWTKAHPNVPPSFDHLGQALISERWRADATDYLQAFIRYAEEKYGDRIYAYSFSCGYATEWFSQDLAAPTLQKEQAFREYMKDSAVKIPTAEEMADGANSYRGSESLAYKYLKYSSDNTAELICYFARKAQEVINHQKLVGLFFGYIDIYPPHQNLWCTNSYEKVWASDDIDMLYSPAAYNESRVLLGTSSYQVAVDSIAVHKKLYLHEIDHRTELAKYPLDTGWILNDCYDNSHDAIQVLRRELANTLIKNSCLWWFDFFGGYYNSPDYEEEIRRQLRLYDEFAQLPREQTAQVAVFVDPESFLNLKENSDACVDFVRRNIAGLHRCGAPFQLFNLNDLQNIDTEKYKLFVFLNAVGMKEDIREIIEKQLKNKWKFFVGAPCYAADEGLDADAVSRITGMQTETFETGSAEKAEFCGEVFGFTRPVSPCFRIVDSKAEAWAQYQSSGIAVAKKGNTIYSAVGCIPAAVWTKACRMSGVHIYCADKIGLAVCSSFICTNTLKEGICRITMPYDCELEDVFTGERYKTRNCVYEYDKPAGTTVFLKITGKEAGYENN